MVYKLVILDVDGTLVTTKSGATFRAAADDWQWLPGRLEKLAELKEQGAKLAIASNQGGVAWGFFGPYPDGEQAMNAQMSILAFQMHADVVQVCYTFPDERVMAAYYNPDDHRRKPNPGMLEFAVNSFEFTPGDVLMVGDRDEDAQAARAAGVEFAWANGFFKEDV